MKKWFSFLLYLTYLVVFLGIGLEILLRIYNPIPFRLKGDKIQLPINQKYVFQNDLPVFDSVIVHRKNSLGFRGEELPKHPEKFVKIIAIGGSTTECFFNSEDKAWPQVMQAEWRKSKPNVWVNNAGLNGHSSFGHQILLNDIVVKLKPNIVLFLVGVNEMDRSDLDQFEQRILNEQEVQMSYNGWIRNFFLNLSKHSEVLNLVYNLQKAWKAQNQKIFIDKVIKLDPKNQLELPNQVYQVVLANQKKYLPGYRIRLLNLIQTCKKHGIKPVFLTQPFLLGEGVDPSTGTDLAKVMVGKDLNGRLYWQKLELYNQEMRKLCNEEKVDLIDVAKLLPKDSKYFYDYMHFSNTGSIAMGKLIASEAKRLIP